jgi:hypothetical protein
VVLFALGEGLMKSFAMVLFVLALFPVQVARTQSAACSQPGSVATFEQTANDALAAMRTRANELKIGGVAVVAFMPGQDLQSWTSKMTVVGRYKDLPSATDKGSNLLGIAYAKASEMADTLKDSGSNVRPPMTGEFGWQGGVIAHGKSGYLIAAFSGGKSDYDLEVSRAGLARLKALFAKM